MATFSFGRQVNINWNGFEVVGPANTVFSLPDQLYEEFEDDFRSVEPSLTWIDTNEFQTLENNVSASTLSATLPIAITTTTSGKTISFSSTTAPNGYLLTANGSGGVIFTAASTSGITTVVGVSPISAVVSGGSLSVSLNANYQTAGTYVNSVIGTSPASVSTSSGTSTVSIVAGSIDSSHLSATSVGSSQLIASSVGSAAISAGAVGTAKLTSGAAAASTVLTADGSGNASFQATASGGLDAFLLMGA
jgi:hypothetical protein